MRKLGKGKSNLANDEIANTLKKKKKKDIGEGGQKTQTSSYKISKFWGCKVLHGDHS